MKKLVVLMLVVGMASLASAALSISLDPVGGTTIDASTTNVTIDVTGSGAFPSDSVYFQLSSDAGVITGGAVGPDAPSASAIYGTTYPGFPGTPAGQDGPYGSLSNTATTDVPKAGTFLTGFDLDLSALTLAGGDTIELSFATSADFATSAGVFTQTLTVATVPEPMTMALLGLGGLFLRRKK